MFFYTHIHTHTHTHNIYIVTEIRIVMEIVYTHIHTYIIYIATRTGIFDIGKMRKRSYAEPLPRAVIFLQNRFRSQKRCSCHLPAAGRWPV